MTNNDLIPRKEVDEKINHLIEIVEAYISASKRDNTPQWTLVYEMQKAILEELNKELSQIERVNKQPPLFAGKSNRFNRFNFINEKLEEGLSWGQIAKLTGRDRTVEFNFHKLYVKCKMEIKC